MSPPIVATIIIVAVFAALALSGAASPRQRTVGPHRNREWATSVRAVLPKAFDAVQLPTNVAKENRESVRLRDAGPVGNDGWAWQFETPNAATVADVVQRSAALASAINRRQQLVQAVEVLPDPRYEGHGVVYGYRRDPIHAVRSIAEVCEPGQRLMSTPTSSMLCGVDRRGDHVRLPLWKSSTAVFGMTQRGKSSAVQTMLANALPHVADGTVRIRFIDVSAKQGTGYGWMRRDGWFHSWETKPAGAMKTMESMLSDLSDRVSDDVDTSVRIDRRNPLDVLLIEEGPAFLGVKGAADELEHIARQVAALGGVVILVSQGAKEVPVTLRRTLPQRIAFGLADEPETRNAFDGSSIASGVGPHTIPKSDGSRGTVDWRGVSYVDPDGRGMDMVRWWWVEPDWLRAHAAALR